MGCGAHALLAHNPLLPLKLSLKSNKGQKKEATKRARRCVSRRRKNPLFFARRLEERQTECKVCGARVVWDRVELGHHVWTVHGLPLEAYEHL